MHRSMHLCTEGAHSYYLRPDGRIVRNNGWPVPLSSAPRVVKQALQQPRALGAQWGGRPVYRLPSGRLATLQDGKLVPMRSDELRSYLSIHRTVPRPFRKLTIRARRPPFLPFRRFGVTPTRVTPTPVSVSDAKRHPAFYRRVTPTPVAASAAYRHPAFDRRIAPTPVPASEAQRHPAFASDASFSLSQFEDSLSDVDPLMTPIAQPISAGMAVQVGVKRRLEAPSSPPRRRIVPTPVAVSEARRHPAFYRRIAPTPVAASEAKRHPAFNRRITPTPVAASEAKRHPAFAWKT